RPPGISSPYELPAVRPVCSSWLGGLGCTGTRRAWRSNYLPAGRMTSHELHGRYCFPDAGRAHQGHTPKAKSLASGPDTGSDQGLRLVGTRGIEPLTSAV